MSATAIKFEVQLPNADVGTPAYQAVQTFLTNIATLGPIYQYEASATISGVRTQNIAVYGLLTSSQTSTALGYLNALNAALGSNVTAINYNVTTQP